MTVSAKKQPAAGFQARRAKVYARVVRDMRSRTPKEVFATIMAAGIYTKSGRLTKPYRSE